MSGVCPRCGKSYEASFAHCPEDGEPLCQREVTERIGLRFSNYQITSLLGEGAMAEVYLARHVALDKNFAIKIMRQEVAARLDGAAQRFLREAQNLSRIRHPNVVDVTDFGTLADGAVFFVMEYLEGEDLASTLERRGRLPVLTAVSIVRQVGAGLTAAHDLGIVHRDLKPANVHLVERQGRRRVVRRAADPGGEATIEPEGEYDFVKLIDFGVAKDLVRAPDATTAGMMFGTPYYMSPEQATGGQVDSRCDIYALGVMFYEMVVGQVPFTGDSVLEVLNGHVFGEVVPPNAHGVEIDQGTNRTILKCLEKKPADRFQRLEDLSDALAGCYTDSLYLRDAIRLAGQDPEALPVTPEVERSLTGELTALFWGSSGPAAESPPVAAAASDERRRSLTEELSELFGKK